MDIQRAVTFITDDEQWIKKLGIAVLLLLSCIFVIPAFIVGPMLTGYAIQVARNTKDGMDVPLPEWDNFGGYFKDGISVVIAGLVYGLPIFILMLVGGLLVGLGEATDVDALVATGGVLFALLGCIAVIYAIALVAIAPAIYIQYIKHGTFGACMRFREVLDITRRNIGDILISILVVLGISFVIGLVSWIPCLGLIISLATAPYIQMVSAHLYGQIAAKELGKGSKFDDIILN